MWKYWQHTSSIFSSCVSCQVCCNHVWYVCVHCGVWWPCCCGAGLVSIQCWTCWHFHWCCTKEDAGFLCHNTFQPLQTSPQHYACNYLEVRCCLMLSLQNNTSKYRPNLTLAVQQRQASALGTLIFRLVISSTMLHGLLGPDVFSRPPNDDEAGFASWGIEHLFLALVARNYQRIPEHSYQSAPSSSVRSAVLCTPQLALQFVQHSL